MGCFKSKAIQQVGDILDPESEYEMPTVIEFSPFDGTECKESVLHVQEWYADSYDSYILEEK